MTTLSISLSFVDPLLHPILDAGVHHVAIDQDRPHNPPKMLKLTGATCLRANRKNRLPKNGKRVILGMGSVLLCPAPSRGGVNNHRE